MTKIHDLPEAARRALAARATVLAAGIPDERVVIAVTACAEDLDDTFLAVVITPADDTAPPSAGSVMRAPFAWRCGRCAPAWLVANQLAMVEAWNALSLPERNHERTRWVTLQDELRLAERLLARGLITAPAPDDDEPAAADAPLPN